MTTSTHSIQTTNTFGDCYYFTCGMQGRWSEFPANAAKFTAEELPGVLAKIATLEPSAPLVVVDALAYTTDYSDAEQALMTNAAREFAQA